MCISPLQGQGTESATEEIVELEAYTVLGSSITRFDQESGLPVSMFEMDQIEAEGFISPGEFFTEMVFTGSPEFEESADGPNDARGDVTSVNLRGAGPGQTLMLLNGRRLAPHPMNQTVNQTPSVLVNANIIPAGLIDRVDILRDGASAIYGTDASAGVVNTLLENNYLGNEVRFRYGTEGNGDFDEYLFTYKGGFDFNEGKSNLSVFVSQFSRKPIMAEDRWYAFEANKADFLTGNWRGTHGRSSQSPWGRFETNLPGSRDALSQNGVRITDGTGDFHIHNPAFTGDDDDSTAVMATGALIGFDSLPANERFNLTAYYTLTSEVDRSNAFLNFNHAFHDNLKFFAEIGYYHSETWQQRAPAVKLSSEEIIIPAQNYWNPFGPVTFADGRQNPNRLSGITLENGNPLPDEGISIVWEGWRAVDLGPRTVEVESDSYIFTAGFNGLVGKEWYWETGIRYNLNEAKDVSRNRFSKTLLDASLALDTPLALNVFGGPGVNSEEVLAPTRIQTDRYAETELLSYDLRINNPDIISLFGNPVGIAFGVEAREETYLDDRDPRLDGTIIYKDDGNEQNISDVIGVSPTQDTDSSRNVFGAYAETLIPIVGAANRAPLMHRLELQLAGRYEDYNDFGEVSKPKAGLMWYLSPDVLIRASESRGFTAPNLSLLTSIQRSTTGVDDEYRSQYDPSNTDNNGSEYIAQLRNNLGLGPEESTTNTAGLVVRVPFIEGVTLTVDYWSIDIVDRIGTIGANDITDNDRLLMNQKYASFSAADFQVGDASIIGDPRVERAPLTQDDIDAALPDFAPAGKIVRVIDPFVNEANRKIEGWDFGLEYAVPEMPMGRFTLNFEGSYLTKMEDIENEGDAPRSLIQDEINPRFRGKTTVRWRKDNWTTILSHSYISETYDNDVTNEDTGEDWLIEDYHRFNVSFRYSFREGMLDGLAATFGVRNLFDEDPPFNPDESRGYETGLHSNRQRYYYVDLRYKF
jgi:outer membrane receptor protein involved in Fe transport